MDRLIARKTKYRTEKTAAVKEWLRALREGPCLEKLARALERNASTQDFTMNADWLTVARGFCSVWNIAFAEGWHVRSLTASVLDVGSEVFQGAQRTKQMMGKGACSTSWEAWQRLLIKCCHDHCHPHP
eukprot:scaffold38417_cov20-Tisochrysis_lutea.AAC.1